MSATAAPAGTGQGFRITTIPIPTTMLPRVTVCSAREREVLRVVATMAKDCTRESVGGRGGLAEGSVKMTQESGFVATTVVTCVSSDWF